MQYTSAIENCLVNNIYMKRLCVGLSLNIEARLIKLSLKLSPKMFSSSGFELLNKKVETYTQCKYVQKNSQINIQLQLHESTDTLSVSESKGSKYR